MSKGLKKAYEITEAKIQFVSLVDKAANLRTFLLKKSDDGKATFTTCGRIVKADLESHHVTGIVYEPLAEDSQGNYMTEAEITKAAYWFAKNSNQVDIQHSFKPFKGGAVVESWIAKADFAIGKEQVKKGTWLMTVEVEDPEIWKSIEKGDITGFSMGGIGSYSEENVDLDNVNKQDVSEKKGLLKSLAKWMGFEVSDQDTSTELHLCNEEPAAPVIKAGKKMSGRNKETLAGIYESLGAFLKEFDDPEPKPDDDETREKVKEAEGAAAGKPDSEIKPDKEDKEVNKEDVQKIVDEAIAKALSPQGKTTPQNGPQAAPAPAAGVSKEEGGQEPAVPAITPETIAKMVSEAIEKAAAPKQEPVTVEQVQEMITASVAKAIDPLLKSKGLPSNLGTGTGTVEKQKEHFLHGIL